MQCAASELSSLLQRAGLRGLRHAFEDEELTPFLLRSMTASTLAACLAEMGCTDEVAAMRLWQLLHVSDDASPDASAEPSDSRAHELRVRELQDEFFADDLCPPACAASWSDDALRAFFEFGGEAPREAGAECESAGPTEPMGEVVGELCIRWQASELRVDFCAATTVGAVKAQLERRTTVPAARQKLLGWADRRVDDSARVSDVRVSGKRLVLVGSPKAQLASAERDLERSRRTARLIHRSAARAPASPLARALTLRRSDFKEPTESAASGAAALARPRRRAEGPIHAERGAGIYLDPAVWAPTPDDLEHRGSGRGSHVLNPRRWCCRALAALCQQLLRARRLSCRSNRVEALDLSNALLGAGAAGGRQARPGLLRRLRSLPFASLAPCLLGRRWRWARTRRTRRATSTSRGRRGLVGAESASRLSLSLPQFRSLPQQAWGRCTACERCRGYERRLEPAANHNDVDALRCARCGCQGHVHERL